MTIFRITDSAMEQVEETTFAQEKLLERRDLQRLIKADISVISPDLMVIKDEFGDWEDSKRRIDLLCLDRDAHLVVLELFSGLRLAFRSGTLRRSENHVSFWRLLDRTNHSCPVA